MVNIRIANVNRGLPLLDEVMARAAGVVALVAAAALLRRSGGAAPGGCPCEDCSDPRLRNASSWALYRLSDVFAHTLSTYDACFWPDSIACDYGRHRAGLSDLPAFLGAVRRAAAARGAAAPAPSRGAVVWHLRLGDTVNCSDAFEAPCARNAKYVLQRSYFEAVADALPAAARDVALVYALGHEACKGAADPRHVANSGRYVARPRRRSLFRRPRPTRRARARARRSRPPRPSSGRAASASPRASTRTPTTT